MTKRHEAYNTCVIVKDLSGSDDRQTAGGIYIPQYDMTRNEGIVEDIGPNAFDDFGERKPQVGDKIIFARYAGKDLGAYEDGFERRIMRDVDILCKVVETE